MNAPWRAEQFTIPAPVGKKFCATCTKPMNIRDNHARCQKCRNAGGYLALKYHDTCRGCGGSYTKAKTTTKGCTISCGQKVRRMEERECKANASV